MTREQLNTELLNDDTPPWRRMEIVVQLWKMNETN
jgi:hypothetical protein